MQLICTSRKMISHLAASSLSEEALNAQIKEIKRTLRAELELRAPDKHAKHIVDMVVVMPEYGSKSQDIDIYGSLYLIDDELRPFNELLTIIRR